MGYIIVYDTYIKVLRGYIDMTEQMMNKNDNDNFKVALTQQMERLEDEKAVLEIDIEDMKTQVRILDDQIYHIEALLESESNDDSTLEVDNASMGKNRYADKVVELIKNRGKPMHYREIYESLRQMGFKLPEGKDPATTLLARYYNDSRLFRPKRGTYAIKQGRNDRSVGTRKSKGRK